MADTFEIQLTREAGYRFQVDFRSDGVPPLAVDESPPLGEGRGPNPARLLAAAVGDCLSASLLFCLGKSRIEAGSLRTTVSGHYRRNERGRLRIGGLEVALVIELPGGEPARAARCLELFEDFCVVTASVRRGIPVGVSVSSPDGTLLYRSAPDPAAGSPGDGA